MICCIGLSAAGLGAAKAEKGSTAAISRQQEKRKRAGKADSLEKAGSHNDMDAAAGKPPANIAGESNMKTCFTNNIDVHQNNISLRRLLFIGLQNSIK